MQYGVNNSSDKNNYLHYYYYYLFVLLDVFLSAQTVQFTHRPRNKLLRALRYATFTADVSINAAIFTLLIKRRHRKKRQVDPVFT